MITEKDLIQAIRECEQEPVTASKVGKLADLYIIQDHLFGAPINSAYSYENKTENLIYTNGGNEFLQAANGKDVEKVMNVLNELVEAVKTLHPRMYNRVIEKLTDI